MSRKTLRNASKNAFKKNARLGVLGRSAYAKIGLSSLALGSMTLGLQGVANAQNASTTKGSDQPAVPGAAAKTKRRGHPAKPMASTGLFSRGGAGLLAQNMAQTPSAKSTTLINTSTNGGNSGQSLSSSEQRLQPIIVTGIRGSLQRSLQIKKHAIGVVDAISAEQIGQFPDSTIGGAISHIPGVTVNRGSLAYASAAGAPTATGLVQGVNVNGFGGSFNTILEDGRQTASGNGQTFNFSDLSAIYVGEIDVHKTPDMALSSGNIGSTINIKFPDPFDNPGLHAHLQVAEGDYLNDGGMRPAVGALISDTFDNNKFGILVDGDYIDHHTLTHHQDIVGWKGIAAGGFSCADLAANYTTAFGSTGCSSVGSGATGNAQVPVWYPQDMAMYLERVDTRSKDGRVAVQWHPNNSVMVTLDDNYSSYDQHINRWQRSTWFGGFPDASLGPNGTINNFRYTGPTDFNAFMADQYIVTNTYGLNVLWNVNDDWTLELDADQSKSEFNPNGTYTDVDSDVGFGNSYNNYTGGLVLNSNNNVLPYWSAYGPNSTATGSTASTAGNVNGLNPFIIGSHVLPMQTQENRDQINEAQIKATWNPGDRTKVKFGAQFIDDDWNTKEFDTFTNNYWELWSGYGPASHNPPGNGVSLPASMFSSVPLGTWMPGYSGQGNLPSSMLLFSPFSVLNYLINQPVNPSANATAVKDGYPAYTGGYIPPEALSTSSVQHVARMNYAPFVVLTHDFRVDGMKLAARLGLRYQLTDSTIAGLSSHVTSVSWLGAGDPTAYSFALSKPVWTQTTQSYGYFLPALDLNLWPTRDIKIGFDFSRTESQPPNSLLIPNTSYGGRVNALTATGNNPGLKPYLSNNFDLRLSWYYAHGDYAEVHPFFKEVSNFPTSSVSTATLPINDPAPCTYVNSSGVTVFTDSNCGKPMKFAETTYTNKLSADVTGVTFTWQQMLPYGFGFLLNGTYMHTNRNFNDYSTTSNQFALTGVGNSANFEAFYQHGKWQGRVTLGWQGKELLLLGQEQGGGAFGNEPVYLAPATQMDVSTHYQVDKHLNVFFEVSNLLDSVYHTYGRFSNQTLNLVNYGRSVTFGVRAKF